MRGRASGLDNNISSMFLFIGLDLQTNTGFDVRDLVIAQAIFLIERGIAGPGPEVNCDTQQQHESESAAFPGTRARQGYCWRKGCSLCGHNFLRKAPQGLGRDARCDTLLVLVLKGNTRNLLPGS